MFVNYLVFEKYSKVKSHEVSRLIPVRVTSRYLEVIDF